MMRRIIFVLLSLFVPLLFLAVVWAQDDSPDVTPQPGIQLAHHPPQMLSADSMVTVETSDGEKIELAAANDASNSCTGATSLSVPGGGSTTVNSFDIEEDADPNLACAWGKDPNDPDKKGYRTAWYQFTPTSHGLITIDTRGSSYDTVLSVFDSTNGICSGDEEPLACNDDYNGFSSRVQFLAVKNRTYYVQVADWHDSASGDATLSLDLTTESIDSNWEQMGGMSEARSRHATTIVGDNIYVIGGQTVDFDPFGDNNPTITNSFDRYNTTSKTWTSLPDMPNAAGYSNTTAAYVNTDSGTCNSGCIFVPGGYTGGTSYDGTHWAFDLGGNLWVEKASIGNDKQPGWPDGTPFAWSAAVTTDNLGYYLIGGLSSQPAISNTTALVHNKVFRYEISSDTWITETKTLPNGRYGHTAAYVDEKICIVGGIEDTGFLTPNGLCWDPLDTKGWEPMTGSGLETARYGAGSSVGPDGKWYVYGGADGFSQAVSTVEVWDPTKGTWSTLGATKDLGITDALPPRIWPRGGFVGNYLWAVGGNDSLTTNSRISISEMERLFVGQNNYLLPIILNSADDGDDNFGTADSIAFNASYYRNFDNSKDFYDFYTFNLTSRSGIVIRLRDIPNNSDYNVYVYDDNKRQWGKGIKASNQNEKIEITLDPGRYYVVVERVVVGPLNTKNYELRVEK